MRRGLVLQGFGLLAAAVCLALLRREGVLPLTFPKDEEESLKQFTFNGARVTFGNVEFLRGRFGQILGEIADGGKFAPRDIELLNAALAQARGMRFRLDRVLSPARDAEDTVFFRPLTFDFRANGKLVQGFFEA